MHEPSPASPIASRPARGSAIARAGACLAGLLLLAGCAGSGPVATYDLSLPRGAARQAAGGAQLLVAEPVALQTLEGDRLVVRGEDGSTSFLGGAQWSDRLPRLLQSRLVQSFENAGKAVGRAGTGLTADYVLAADIRFFGVETRAGGAQAAIEISAKVVDNTGRIVASRVFRGAAPLAEVAGPQAATTLDGVMTPMLTEIVRWVGSRA
nr:ABC-type transport auxiliary lipoprotein family protein [Alsobacter ponti]